MKVAIKYSEFFIKLEDEIMSYDPVELGSGLLMPGMLFHRLGEKDRTAIVMQEGYYLEYVGSIEDNKYLLFKEYLQDWGGWLSALIYVNKNILLQQTSENGFRDVVIKHPEPVTNVRNSRLLRNMIIKWLRFECEECGRYVEFKLDEEEEKAE